MKHLINALLQRNQIRLVSKVVDLEKTGVNERDQNMYKFKTDRIIVMTLDPPSKTLQQIRERDINFRVRAVIFPSKQFGLPHLREKHEGEYSGMFEFKFSKPIDVQINLWGNFKNNIPYMFVEGDYNTMFDWYKQASSIKILAELKKEQISNLPASVRHFIDVYIAMGTRRFEEGAEEYQEYQKQLSRVDWKKVMQWYQHTKHLPYPKYVYRGVSSEDFKDEHHTDDFTRRFRHHT